MPRIKKPPPYFMKHLVDRFREGRISVGDFDALQDWLTSNPELPPGKWYKQFSKFTLAGEGSFVTASRIALSIASTSPSINSLVIRKNIRNASAAPPNHRVRRQARAENKVRLMNSTSGTTRDLSSYFYDRRICERCCAGFTTIAIIAPPEVTASQPDIIFTESGNLLWCEDSGEGER
jgi:hypothetical protein